MKKIILSTLIIASIAISAFSPKFAANEVNNFTVDVAKSKVEFTGSKTSDFHTGFFPLTSGAVKIEEGKLVGGSFVVNVAGLKVTDPAGEKLQGHLFSADFLDAIKFGEATFIITSVTYTKGDRATVKGDLSLHGMKAPITFTAYIRSTDPTKGFFAEAFFPLDRTTFGINYGVGMIDTDVQLAIHLYATK